MKLPCDNYKIDVCLSGICNVCVPLILENELEESEPVAEPIEVPVVVNARKKTARERS
jgi:hypothetical protein